MPRSATLEDIQTALDVGEAIGRVKEARDSWRRTAERLESEKRALIDALKVAKHALYEARCGLDLGLGCARDLEDDHGPRATKPRSARQETYLEDARTAFRTVAAALDNNHVTGGTE